MTDADKAAAFDLIARSHTNQWSDGSWGYWSPRPNGGPKRATRAEAVADLVELARREANHVERRGKAYAATAAG